MIEKMDERLRKQLDFVLEVDKEKNIFRLIYDYGDNWIFNITVKEIMDKPGTETVVKRRVGTVSQYPDYDDMEWERARARECSARISEIEMILQEFFGVK